MAAGSAAGIRTELARARASGQVHGAYLFEGPSGTGKRETAAWFARLLLCETTGDEPCGGCRGCLRSEPRGEQPAAHPDLWSLEPEGAVLRVDQIRELQRALALMAHEGGHRVALIHGAERLRREAANALLKTLEEPPRGATLVLISTAARMLPPTVVSRTTRFRFRALAESTIEAALVEEGLDPEDAWLAAALGGGSVESARAWAEASLDEARALRAALADAPRSSVSDLLDFAESFRGGVHTRSRAELFLDVHAALARHEIAAAAHTGERAPLERWLEQAEAGQRARREITRRNLNPQLVVEGLVLGLRAEGCA